MSKTAKAVRRKYNLLAKLYDHLWPAYIRQTIDAALKPVSLTGRETILDIGCGTGALESILIQKYPHLKIVGIDLSEDMLAQARVKLQQALHVTLKQGDFLKTDLPEGSFDIVFSLSNLHYFPNPEAIFQKVFLLLKNGGTFVLLDWNRHSLKAKIYNTYMRFFDPGFVKVYTPEEVSPLLKKNGFQVTDIKSARVSLLWYMMRLVAKKGGVW